VHDRVANPPADPQVRAFLDSLAEAVAESVLRELASEEQCQEEAGP